jgi:hypothetical protein
VQETNKCKEHGSYSCGSCKERPRKTGAGTPIAATMASSKVAPGGKEVARRNPGDRLISPNDELFWPGFTSRPSDGIDWSSRVSGVFLPEAQPRRRPWGARNGRRLQRRRLQGLLLVHGRQVPGQGARQHALAGAGRTHQQEVVATDFGRRLKQHLLRDARHLDAHVDAVQERARDLGSIASPLLWAVARTVADLAGLEVIETPQLTEAITYRRLGRKIAPSRDFPSPPSRLINRAKGRIRISKLTDKAPRRSGNSSASYLASLRHLRYSKAACKSYTIFVHFLPARSKLGKQSPFESVKKDSLN